MMFPQTSTVPEAVPEATPRPRIGKLAILVIVYLFLNQWLPFWTAVGCVAVGYNFFCCASRFSLGIFPILELMLVITGLQWVLMPIYFYYTPMSYPSMAVPEDLYMGLTVSGYLALMGGVYFRQTHLLLDLKNIERNKEVYTKFGFLFLAIGFIGWVLSTTHFYFSNLAFLFFLFSVSGLFILEYCRNHFALILGITFIALQLVSGAQSTMLQNLVLWLAWYVMIIFCRRKMRTWICISLFLFGLVAVCFLQEVKYNYRSEIGMSQRSFNNFFDAFAAGFERNYLKEYTQLNFWNRFNQGYSISLVYGHIPESRDFLYGQELIPGMVTSFLPRAIFPWKYEAASHERYADLTGIYSPFATMSVSVLGDAYSNFGQYGMLIFLLLYGMFLNAILRLIITEAGQNYIPIFLIPLPFYNVMKGEVEFISIFNHLVKLLIIIWVLHLILKECSGVYRKLSDPAD